MYGDLQYTNVNTGNKFKGGPKVYKYPAHPKTHGTDFIVGYSGGTNDMVTIHSFFAEPDMFEKPPKPPSGTSGLVLTADGLIYFFNDYRKWHRINDSYAATGSGMDYALGAMASGKTPKEAIKIAMKHDAFTGMGVKGASFD